MDSNKAKNLYEHAQKSAKEHSFFQKIPAFFRMIKAWREGIYKPKTRNIALAIFAIVYAIVPIDFDWAPIIGWVDDFAIVSFAFTRMMKELDRFLDWEQSQNNTQVIDTDAEIVK